MFTQTPMGLESLESAIKYESAVAKHGRGVVDAAMCIARFDGTSFDDALDWVLKHPTQGQRATMDAIVVEPGINRHERRKAAKLARSRR